MHKCVCHIAVLVIHGAIRGLTLQEMFWESHDGEKMGRNPPEGILLGKVGLPSTAPEKGLKKATNTNQMEEKKNNQQRGTQLRELSPGIPPVSPS